MRTGVQAEAAVGQLRVLAAAEQRVQRGRRRQSSVAPAAVRTGTVAADDVLRRRDLAAEAVAAKAALRRAGACQSRLPGDRSAVCPPCCCSGGGCKQLLRGTHTKGKPEDHAQSTIFKQAYPVTLG